MRLIDAIRPAAASFLLIVLLNGCQNDGSGTPAQKAEPPGEAVLAKAETTAGSAETQQPQQKAGLEQVAQISGAMPTGITVSEDNRVFVCFPRWGDRVQFTVAELRGQELVAYPNAQINKLDNDRAGDTLVSVQSVVVDPANRLWLVDTGNINMGKNLPNGPKLVCVDLGTNQVDRIIHFTEDVALPNTYLNDIRFDLREGDDGFAYITDSSGPGPNGIIVVDLTSGQAWRKLHDHPSTQHDKNFTPVVEGEELMQRQPGQPPKPLDIGSDGIALSNDGQTLFYRPLASRHLFSVPTELLRDRGAPDDRVSSAVRDYGDIGFASDGLEFDAQGQLYLTDYENTAVRRGDPNAQSPTFDILVQDPRLIWPDTLSIGSNGYLYIMVNQLNRQARFHNGSDQRQPPYPLMRINVGAQPVRLK